MGSRGRPPEEAEAVAGGRADCPFCAKRASADLLVENSLAFALPDVFPVSPGHALVLPRRHVADYFELSAEEKAALWELVDRCGSNCWEAEGPRASTSA